MRIRRTLRKTFIILLSLAATCAGGFFAWTLADNGHHVVDIARIPALDIEITHVSSCVIVAKQLDQHIVPYERFVGDDGSVITIRRGPSFEHVYTEHPDGSTMDNRACGFGPNLRNLLAKFHLRSTLRHRGLLYFDYHAGKFFHRAMFPAWVPFVLLAAYPASTILRGPLRRFRRRRKGLCIACGYNLTGLTENRCPECATEFETAK